MLEGLTRMSLSNECLKKLESDATEKFNETNDGIRFDFGNPGLLCLFSALGCSQGGSATPATAARRARPAEALGN